MVTLALAFAEAELPEWAQAYSVPERERRLIELVRGAGTRGHLSQDEFLQIAKWKSSRPTRFYLKNSGPQVAEVTARAFGASNDTERALWLTELEGVNVRTATAILHLCFPNDYPLLDVWAMTALGVPRETTEKWDELDWLRIWPGYVRTCRRIADRTKLDLRTIDRALWAFGEGVGSRRKKQSTVATTDKELLTRATTHGQEDN